MVSKIALEVCGWAMMFRKRIRESTLYLYVSACTGQFMQVQRSLGFAGGMLMVVANSLERVGEEVTEER